MSELRRTLHQSILGVLFATLLSVPAVAQETGPNCARIEDDAERLACYDRAFRTDSPPVAGSVLTMESERLIPALPTGREPAEMIVSCEDGLLTVQFRFAGQLFSATGGIAPITFQVDQNATSVRSLRASADNASAGFWTTAESNAFLDSLAGGTNLKVRMTPVRQRSLTVDFRLLEQRDAIQAVRAACAG